MSADGLTVQGKTLKTQVVDTVLVKNPNGGSMLINKSDYNSKVHGRVLVADAAPEESAADPEPEASAPKAPVKKKVAAKKAI